jgi:Protein of unknown function (DUF3048) N-terminal domain/Protein of unknown function (DUF3048) C-terminal domain
MRSPHGGRRVAAAVAASTIALLGACGSHPSAQRPTGASSTSSTAPTSTSLTTQHHALEKKRRHHVKRKRGHVHAAHLHAAHLHTAHLHAVHVHALSAPPTGLCPLTGERAPGGHVPQRAAVAVKVENLPAARPQYGLDKADIVFEEPVEGGITRFIAVFQCQTAARIEPVRSARLVDAQILEPLGRILFAYSGAIQPVINEVDARTSLLHDVGGYMAPNAYWRDPDRYEPHNLETSTAALYAAAAQLHYPEKPPVAIFSYGRPVKGATPASVVNIHYPIDVTTWTWHRDTGLWYRSYSDTGPALLGDGTQIAASNVIVMLVRQWPTPYPEDITGALENELTLKGSGPAWVFRDGAQYYGKWERPLLDHPTVFVATNGNTIRLTPGNTWEELVPDGLAISVKP